jgi:hypothetical protein
MYYYNIQYKVTTLYENWVKWLEFEVRMLVVHVDMSDVLRESLVVIM